ncbi:MAG: hypothetical protein LBP39_02195 [Rickettsiales bacterium]|jgi:hypothetical protein|nr:hypothetical protein [Rickettsiales bacterium]
MDEQIIKIRPEHIEWGYSFRQLIEFVAFGWEPLSLEQEALVEKKEHREARRDNMNVFKRSDWYRFPLTSDDKKFMEALVKIIRAVNDVKLNIYGYKSRLYINDVAPAILGKNVDEPEKYRAIAPIARKHPIGTLDFSDFRNTCAIFVQAFGEKCPLRSPLSQNFGDYIFLRNIPIECFLYEGNEITSRKFVRKIFGKFGNFLMYSDIDIDNDESFERITCKAKTCVNFIYDGIDFIRLEKQPKEVVSVKYPAYIDLIEENNLFERVGTYSPIADGYSILGINHMELMSLSPISKIRASKLCVESVKRPVFEDLSVESGEQSGRTRRINRFKDLAYQIFNEEKDKSGRPYRKIKNYKITLPSFRKKVMKKYKRLTGKESPHNGYEESTYESWISDFKKGRYKPSTKFSRGAFRPIT